ncbi:hsp70-Hsp90 organizing protein 1-like isoform X1 [Glycine soja]|uniref:hsp70-Hsp90 organizing protein 1-like isoform X1 n=1 Tax=Glycine soja TaxID=3848 RepID=UPI0003DE730D|nr:hsp70-Hsp90 organizing protein 1-like isoform X1 [Glycine soja]
MQILIMKEYDKALETYREGLKHDPNNEDLLDGIRRYGIVLHSCYFWELILPLSICTMTMQVRNHHSIIHLRCLEQINKAIHGDFTPEELKERQAKAMQDPEIQSILQDPVMRQVLIDFQENPRAAEEHAKNPMVMNKIQKLISAEIVQMR